MGTAAKMLFVRRQAQEPGIALASLDLLEMDVLATRWTIASLEQADVLQMPSAPRQVLASTFVRVNLVLQGLGLHVLPLTFVQTTTVAVTPMQTVN